MRRIAAAGTERARVREDAIALSEVLDAGAEVEDFTGDVLAQDAGVLNSEAVVAWWGVADLPVDGAERGWTWW